MTIADLKYVTWRIATLQDEIANLSMRRAEIIRQLQAEGWTYQAIADELGVSRSIIDKLAQRAEPIAAKPRGVRGRAS